MNTIAPFKYLDDGMPKGYACSVCKLTGVRLFRLPHAAADTKTGHTLWCLRCAIYERTETRSCWPRAGEGVGNVGYLCWAVPTEDGSTFWGIGGVPEDGARWWNRLPAVTIEMLVRPKS